MAKKSVKVFTLFHNKEKKSSYLKADLSKFGIKSLKVELNSGQVLDLTKQNVLFINDPREGIKKSVENGKIDEAYAQERIKKLDDSNISREVVLLID